jgi:hypothetical protein
MIQFIKLGRGQGLRTVTQGTGGIIVNLHHDTIRTAGDGCQGHGADETGFSGSMAGINHNRQVR